MLPFGRAHACALGPLLLIAVLACNIHLATANCTNKPLNFSSALHQRSAFDNAAVSGDTNSSAGGRSLSSQQDFASAPNYTALECSRYDPTYSQIERDLEIHRKLGTSWESTLYMSTRYGGVSMRGITVGFFGGVAYLLTPTDFPGLSHHAPLHLAYMRMLLHLERSFGAGAGAAGAAGAAGKAADGAAGDGAGHLPDVAFVLTTSDTPRYTSPLLINSSSPSSTCTECERGFVPGPYPVMGICKSDFFPDLLLVPNFHFHMKLYDKTFLEAIPEFNKVPWKDRKPVLFGRFSHYRTNRISVDSFTLKTGIGGRRVCYKANRTCPFRDYFIKKVVPMAPARMDVSFIGRVPMQRHAEFKYLVHLDGQGISSRLEQLLPMGSLVFKQASGYYAYYYSLLRHRGNLVEFWRGPAGGPTGPEDVLTELDWAAAHEGDGGEAAAVAAAGQRLAATYLTGNGRTCYWYRLLHGLRRTLSYTPSLDQWPAAQPLRRVLEEQLLASPGGRELYDMPWAP